jgi:tetratricopeptide (TPR) repeat protein
LSTATGTTAQGPAERAAPLKLFLSYAHEDDAHREALVEHLTPLIDAGVFTLWHDRRLTGGQNWAGQIDQHLAEADIVLLLVSRHFLASEYCKGVEVAQALAKETAGQLRVIPVVLKSCAWTDAPIGRLQALPRDGLPIVESPYPDQLYQQVVEGLKQVALELRPALLKEKAPAPIPLAGGLFVSPPAPPTHPPRLPWSLQTGWRVAIAGLAVLLLAGGLVAWWMAALTAAVDDDLRIDRPDLALERLEPLPGWLDAWPGMDALRQTARLHDDSRKASADGTRIERALTALLAHRPNDAHLLFVRARRMFLQGNDRDIEAMQTALSAVLAADPRYAAAESLLGLLADRIGQVDVAAVRHAKALELAPDLPQYQLNHARSLLDQGRVSEARDAYAQVDASYALGHAEAALAAWALGQPAAAEARQAQALKLMEDPQVMERYANRGDWVFLFVQADQGGRLEITEQQMNGATRRCYVEAEWAISASLTEPAQSLAGLATWPPACSDRKADKHLAQLIGADLCRYVIQAGEAAAPFAETAQAWRAKLGVKSDCAPLLHGRSGPQS